MTSVRSIYCDRVTQLLLIFLTQGMYVMFTTESAYFKRYIQGKHKVLNTRTEIDGACIHISKSHQYHWYVITILGSTDD